VTISFLALFLEFRALFFLVFRAQIVIPASLSSSPRPLSFPRKAVGALAETPLGGIQSIDYWLLITGY